MRSKANLAFLFVAIIWGSAFVAQGIAGQFKVAYLFNGLSFTLAALLLIPFIPSGTRIVAAQIKWILIAGFALFFASAFQQVGLNYTKVANAGFLTSLYVVFTPFLLWLGFREKPHGLDLAAVVIACVGAFLLSTAGAFEMNTGDGLELAGAVFWAVHFVILGKYGSKFEPISFAAGHFFVTGLLNLAVGLVYEDTAVLTALPLLAAILYRATLSIGVGYTIQVWGQKYTTPTDAALILGLEAVFAVIAGWLILNQSLVPIQILGCVLIFVGVLISQLKGLSSPVGATLQHEPS